jgi:hypothetical protein
VVDVRIVRFGHLIGGKLCAGDRTVN